MNLMTNFLNFIREQGKISIFAALPGLPLLGNYVDNAPATGLPRVPLSDPFENSIPVGICFVCHEDKNPIIYTLLYKLICTFAGIKAAV